MLPDANRDRAWRAEQQSRRHRAPWRAAARRRRAAQTPLLRAFTSDLTADRKDQGMRVLRSTAVILALIMMSAPRAASAQTQPAAIAPEHQEMAAKRAKERERVNNCQKQATDQHILPRDDRTKSAVRHRAGVPGAGRQKSEGKRKSGRLPATGQRTKSFTPRSAAIRHQLPGQQIAQQAWRPTSEWEANLLQYVIRSERREA